jgi:hypothetical protein
MTIGITLGIMKDNESMWINGIKLNAIFLANMFKALGHDVYLLDTSMIVDANELTGKLDRDKIVWDTDEFPIYRFLKKWEEVDILVTLGTAMDDSTLKMFKEQAPHKKVVKYMCGNNYVLDMERILFRSDKDQNQSPTLQKEIDELWYVPQQEKHNHDYYRILHYLDDDKVKPVPFIWDPMFIDKTENQYGGKLEDGTDLEVDVPIYQPKELSKMRLTCMEPNMNTVKFHMIPMMIAEEAFRHGYNFEVFNIISANRLMKSVYWKTIIGKLKMFDPEDCKISVHNRYPVHALLAKLTDVVISHQWDNPLNYAYLDVMYLQYPLVHNAHMIQDAGYYYPEFDVKEGTKQLEYVFNHHNDNIDTYNERNEEVLTRYTVYNEDMLETYRKLIDNLVAGENKHKLSYKYNWKTNVYK